MHVKHDSSVTFYHLSNRCLPNVLKINVKINTMQNTNILLFVRSLSLLTVQLTSEESVSTHVFVQLVDILNIFVNKLLQTISILALLECRAVTLPRRVTR